MSHVVTLACILTLSWLSFYQNQRSIELEETQKSCGQMPEIINEDVRPSEFPKTYN